MNLQTLDGNRKGREGLGQLDWQILEWKPVTTLMFPSSECGQFLASLYTQNLNLFSTKSDWDMSEFWPMLKRQQALKRTTRAVQQLAGYIRDQTGKKMKGHVTVAPGCSAEWLRTHLEMFDGYVFFNSLIFLFKIIFFLCF